MNEVAKTWFVQTALAYLGTPYIWGGDDPSGFDCSGFVLECLKSAGLIGEKEDYSADALMRKYASNRIETPREGALLFTLNAAGKASHVVICLDDCFQIGASGGTAKTLAPAAAWRDNAYVKVRPIRMRQGSTAVVDPFM